MKEKRQAPRIQPYVAPCRVVESERRIPGYVTDLSTMGARISADVPPPDPGTPVVLEIRFGRQLRHSRLAAEVKWIRPAAATGESHSFGITFTGVTAEEQRALESVVEEFQRRAAQISV
ncbi:MAG: PilZ domain-containing protein [Acidobacteria bacterium]|nr:PilZ domain-containing protein [Acidobacteriota bacterium]